GNLKNSTMGVFQIVALNSSEEYSWGGSFNTSSKYKTATVTVRLQYNIK
ncbi:MAG TPA: SIMPL domain-containing protein, partial [Paludibacteraceae bacterium]|nr:SIMPL domain-containing protein [Paludibacteraceae bacterium]